MVVTKSEFCFLSILGTFSFSHDLFKSSLWPLKTGNVCEMGYLGIKILAERRSDCWYLQSDQSLYNVT